MNSYLRISTWAVALVLVVLVLPAHAGSTNSFTYQGELRLADTPIAGAHDFRFQLFNAETGGNQQGSQIELSSVPVLDGVFTVSLDFGSSAFTSQPRWLEIQVRDSSVGGSYQTLSPRTRLTAVPFALASNFALARSVNTDSIEPGAVGAGQINTSQVQRRVADICTGGQAIAQINSDGSVACVSGGSGWSLTGNAGTNPANNFVGTTDAAPLVLRAGNQRLALFESVSTGQGPSANIIMGSPENFIGPGVRGATIGGGGAEDTSTTSRSANRVLSNWGTVAGGFGNTAGSDSAPQESLFPTVGGGWNNIAGRQYATVAGGFDNIARGSYSAIIGGDKNRVTEAHGVVAGGKDNQVHEIAGTVSGGNTNFATGQNSTVAGGSSNTASNRSSTVSGGELNCAGGSFSWAGGRRAKVRPGSGSGAPGPSPPPTGIPPGCIDIDEVSSLGGDQGTFVWADSQNQDFVSTGPNRFLVRAQGGFFFGAGGQPNIPAGRFINTSTDAHLTTGGAWTNSSSRYLKSDFESLDVSEVLAGVLELPISRWLYRDSPGEGQHMGPMAEDFYAIFGLGVDSSVISSVDASGVALAAIQGLNQQLEAENLALREHNARQDAELDAMREELAELRRLVEARYSP